MHYQWPGILILLLYVALLQANEALPFKIERLTTANGLAQNSVECIFQDSQGFMWFGTQNGLSRYDGYCFRNFVHDPLDSNSISTNAITTLNETKRYLWIGSSADLNLYDKNNGTFKSLPIQAVSSIVRDGQGKLWMGSLMQGLFVSDSTGQNWAKYNPHNSALKNSIIHALFVDKEGLIWIGTEHCGLYRMDNSQGRFSLKAFRHLPDNPNSLSSDFVTAICQDSKGNYWIGTRRHGLNYLTAKGTFRHIRYNSRDGNSLPDDEIRSLFYDKNSETLWIGFYNKGLCRLQQDAKGRFIFSNFRHLAHDTGSLNADCVTALSMDFSGTLWLGTHGGGVAKKLARTIQFHKVRHIAGRPETLLNDQVWAFGAGHNDSLWVGSSGEISLFTANGSLRNHPLISFASIKRNDQIRAIQPADPGKLWLAFMGKGLFRYDYQRHTLQPFPWDDPLLPIYEKNLYSMYDDRRGHLWIGSNGGGLVKFDKKRAEFTSYNIRYKKKFNPDFHGWVITIVPDSAGNLWLGTWKSGLIKFSPRTGRSRYFVHESKNPAGINGNTVFCIHPSDTDKHILWLGTYCSGLNKMNTLTGTFESYIIRNGLPDNAIYGIVEDRFHKLWLSSNNGLSCFDPQLRFFKNYTIEDGLPDNEFNLGACYKNSKGRIYFGTSRGFIYFDPENVSNLIPPRLALMAFKKYGKKVSFGKPLNQVKKIEISSRVKIISFEFSALHFKNSAKNQYAYMMEGFDPDWVYCGFKREAIYTNLTAGNYIFRVKAANCDGVWNERGLSVALQILPPLWKRGWFFALSALILLMLLFAAYRIHLKKIIEIEKARMEEGERLRRKMSADFHDELGHRVTKILFLSKLLEEKSADPEMGKYLKKIIGNADNLFKELREFIWELNPAENTLYDLAVHLKNFSDQLFDQTEIAFELQGLSVSMEKNVLPLNWRRELLHIFKEAMHNVLKHAKSCKTVILHFTLNDNLLTVTLIDDGKGFDIQSALSGNGFKNMYNRASTINGRLDINSSIQEGTSVKFVGKLS